MAKKKESKEKFHASSPAPALPKPDDDYQAEDDARTLMRAHEINEDEKRRERAHGHLSKQKKKIKSIEDLKRIAYAKK